jgi:G:T/U-mismatch repair DNA glycosylase/ADP-ribose pyrophosphatase YjhB (NUDIX family)
VSAAAAAHFANPRNDFWRLLYDAGFTPRLFHPSEQFELLRYGVGLTNAAPRTTKGSGDLRRADFLGSAERLERIAHELRPRAIGFVGKEAYRGVFGARPEHGLQERHLDETLLFVLPSTSPANAAVPYAERLRWFRGLADLVGVTGWRSGVRAIVIDPDDRVPLLRYRTGVWALPGGGVEHGESEHDALCRELAEELGLDEVEVGPLVWTRSHDEPFGQWRGQREHFYLVRVPQFDLAPGIDLAVEHVVDLRWWTLDEIERSTEVFAPRRLGYLLRDLITTGPPAAPIDTGI